MRPTMTISIHNKDQAQPMLFSKVDNTYVKAGFFCLVMREINEVVKFPVSEIFRVIEPYYPDDHLRQGLDV
jgi:hypothetical protein